METRWIFAALACVLWSACNHVDQSNASRQPEVAGRDSVALCLQADSLQSVADTATAREEALLLQVADLYRSARNRQAWIGVLNRLYRGYNKNKAFEKTSELFERAIQQAWWPEDSQTGTLYLGLGYALLKLNRYYTASIYYEKARALSDQFGNVVKKNPARQIYKTLANIKTRLGENEEAAKIHLAAIELLRKDTAAEFRTLNQLALADVHSDLGIVYQSVDDLPHALTQYEAGLAVLQNLRGLSTDEAPEAGNARGMLLSNKASVLYLMGQVPQAENAVTEALRILQPEKAKYRFSALEILAEIQEHKTDTAAARQTRLAAMALAAGGEVEKREVAKLLNSMGWSALRQKDFEAATSYAQQALHCLYAGVPANDYRKNPDPSQFDLDPENAVAEALDLKGEALWQLYRQSGAGASLYLADSTTALAIQMMENLRDAAVYESSKLNSAQQGRRLFSRMMRILYAQQEAGAQAAAERAFAYAEKSKAVLLQQKVAADAALQAAGVADSLIRQERDLRDQWAALRNALFERQMAGTEETDSSGMQMKQRLYQIEEQQRRLRRQISDAYGLAPDRQETHTATVAEVRQRLLRDRETLVEYFTDRDSSAVYLIAVDQQTVRLLCRSYEEEGLRQLIACVNNAQWAENRSADPALWTEFTQLSRQWYSTLLEPLFPKSVPPALMLAPDGALSLLPFDLLLVAPLQPSKNRTLDYATLPYLVMHSQTRLVPSASLELFYDKAQLPRHTGSYAGFAPDYSGSVLGRVNAGPTLAGQAAEKFGGQAFTGSHARLDSFLTQASGYAIVHFHGHAEASDSFPDYSWLAFTAGGPIAQAAAMPSAQNRTLGQPGRLPVRELANCLFAYQIYHSRLDADLVLLSACQTGLGKIAPGEGTLSLARAFQAAGCPATVMTLWEVRDDATAALTGLFLDNIRKGQEKDEALTQAKRRYLATAGDVFPYYWAGFVLTGKADPVRLPGAFSGKSLLLISGGLALAFLLLALVRRGLK